MVFLFPRIEKFTASKVKKYSTGEIFFRFFAFRFRFSLLLHLLFGAVFGLGIRYFALSVSAERRFSLILQKTN